VSRHLERIEWSPSSRRPPDTSSWPYTIPAVGQIIREGGLDVADGVTFLVGENGSGKSTLIEAFAAIYPREGHRAGAGADVEGPVADRANLREDDSPLMFHLRARTHKLASPAGFFLRAESMHEYLDRVGGKAWGNERLQARSHGESFLTVLRHRFEDVGVYFLDEPESALSFQSCLGLVSLLATMRREGSQIIVATHSPLLVSLPGATLLEIGDEGIRLARSYDDLALVKSYRHFMSAPGQFLKHLVEDGND
jgi:predicted ATPase